ncbi:hypothetical protein [Streptosporangium subroseum]|nr:hypothetical protein [Streptosporangium subroseum]
MRRVLRGRIARPEKGKDFSPLLPDPQRADTLPNPLSETTLKPPQETLLNSAPLARRGVSRRTALATLLVVLSIATAIQSWFAYSQGTENLPQTPVGTGKITMILPSDIAALRVTYGQYPPIEKQGEGGLKFDEPSIKITLWGYGRKKPKECIPYIMVAERDAILKNANDLMNTQLGKQYQDEEKPLILKSDNSPLGHGVQVVRGKMCSIEIPDYQSLYDAKPPGKVKNQTIGQISAYSYKHPSAPLTEVYWMPTLNALMSKWESVVFQKKPLLAFIDIIKNQSLDPIKEYSCVTRMDPTRADQKIEGVKPAPDGPGLRWAGCDGIEKSVIIADNQREEENDRSLFISGALIGAAVSFFLFAVQLFLDAPRE